MASAAATKSAVPTMPVPLDQDQTLQDRALTCALVQRANVDAAVVLNETSPGPWRFQVAHNRYLATIGAFVDEFVDEVAALLPKARKYGLC